MNRPASLVALAWIGGAGLLLGARAAAASDAPRAVTLEEAIAGADGAPELVAARAAERGAEAGVRIARLFPDASVSVITNSINARESVSVTLPTPWPARGPRILAAQADRASAAQARDLARASARRALRAAWFGLAAAEERDRAAADHEARARRNAEAITALLEQGRVARLERVRGDAEEALARADRASAAEALRTAGATLAILLGLDPETALATGGARPEPALEGAREEAAARAREAAPEVRLRAAEADAATARLRLAGRQRIPSLGLDAGAEWNDPTQSGTNSFVGLSLTIPIAAPASLLAALAERDRLAALLEGERRAAALAAETAWSASRAARLRLEALDAEVLPASRESADLTRLAYQEGKVDIFRLLDAERLLSEAEVERADAYEAWGIAHADLLRTTARDGP